MSHRSESVAFKVFRVDEGSSVHLPALVSCHVDKQQANMHNHGFIRKLKRFFGDKKTMLVKPRTENSKTNMILKPKGLIRKN